MINVLVEKPTNYIETGTQQFLWMWTEASVKKILQFRIAKGLTVINVLVEKPTNYIETGSNLVEEN